MPTIQKHHVYKVYRNDEYKGNLPTPTNDFSYALNINSAGTQINIQVPISADRSAEAVEALQDEDGNDLLTETGEVIYIERQPDVVGSSNDNILMRNGNTVKVYEYSDYHPNGKLMFTGTINRWEAEFGDGSNEVVSVFVNSSGQDLDNYLVQI